MRTGASLVMALKPTGLRHNSPMVCRKYVSVSHNGLTRPDDAAAGTKTIKPRPTKINPSVNLVGLEGSRRPNQIHNHANTGANAMMNTEFTDWKNAAGKPK